MGLLLNSFADIHELEVLYDSNANEKTATACHDCIDNKGRTLAIAKIGNVCSYLLHFHAFFCLACAYLIFSDTIQYFICGIAHVAWSSSHGDACDDKAVISFISANEIKWFHILEGRECTALYHSLSFGPAFGKYFFITFTSILLPFHVLFCAL